MATTKRVSNGVSGDSTRKVFEGRVTKIHDNFGFINEEVFFQPSVCTGGAAKLGDSVLVEATFNPQMPFKWTATRIQLVNSTSSGAKIAAKKPAESYKSKPERVKGPESRGPSTKPRNRRSRSPIANRKASQARSSRGRNESRAADAGTVATHDFVNEMSAHSISNRYSKLYVPSDFFFSKVMYRNAFPLKRRLQLGQDADFYIMSRKTESPAFTKDERLAWLQPPDADYSFQAKVMLLGGPDLDKLYAQCIDADGRASNAEKLLNFLVGIRLDDKGGKDVEQLMAIGGAWSPSLDGEDPLGDPATLINTAVRTTKALTGINLEPCTNWFKFVEFHYVRSQEEPSLVDWSPETEAKAAPRIETVVIFVPDVWTIMPKEGVGLCSWESVRHQYKEFIANSSRIDFEREVEEREALIKKQTEQAEVMAEAKRVTEAERMEKLKEAMAEAAADKAKTDAAKSEGGDGPEAMDESGNEAKASTEPIEVDGIAALTTTKTFDGPVIAGDDEGMVIEIDCDEKVQSPPMPVFSTAKYDDIYKLGNKPAIIVHPSEKAKGGKFGCAKRSLQQLRNYSVKMAKEHSFEVAVFAELFCEMLSRDHSATIVESLGKCASAKVVVQQAKAKKVETGGGDTVEIVDKEPIPEPKLHRGLANCLSSILGAAKDESKHEHNGVVMRTVEDRGMLFACVWFDRNNIGSLRARELETIISLSGYNLTKTRLKQILNAIGSSGSWRYRSFQMPEITPEQSEMAERMMPYFTDTMELYESVRSVKSQGVSGSGPIVEVEGRIVDVKTIVKALETERLRCVEAVANLGEARRELSVAQKKSTKATDDLKVTNEDLKSTQKKLTDYKSKHSQWEKQADMLRRCMEGTMRRLTTESQSMSRSIERVFPPKKSESIADIKKAETKQVEVENEVQNNGEEVELVEQELDIDVLEEHMEEVEEVNE